MHNITVRNFFDKISMDSAFGASTLLVRYRTCQFRSKTHVTLVLILNLLHVSRSLNRFNVTNFFTQKAFFGRRTDEIEYRVPAGSSSMQGADLDQNFQFFSREKDTTARYFSETVRNILHFCKM